MQNEKHCAIHLDKFSNPNTIAAHAFTMHVRICYIEIGSWDTTKKATEKWNEKKTKWFFFVVAFNSLNAFVHLIFWFRLQMKEKCMEKRATLQHTNPLVIWVLILHAPMFNFFLVCAKRVFLCCCCWLLHQIHFFCPSFVLTMFILWMFVDCGWKLKKYIKKKWRKKKNLYQKPIWLCASVLGTVEHNTGRCTAQNETRLLINV